MSDLPDRLRTYARWIAENDNPDDAETVADILHAAYLLDQAGPVTRTFDLSEYYSDGAKGVFLHVNITDEGVIMDVISENEVDGTVGMMAGEWADLILNGGV